MKVSFGAIQASDVQSCASAKAKIIQLSVARQPARDRASTTKIRDCQDFNTELVECKRHASIGAGRPTSFTMYSTSRLLGIAKDQLSSFKDTPDMRWLTVTQAT